MTYCQWRLNTQGLTAGYTRTPVIENVHLQISGGEIVGLVGQNGSGKSTLLRVLSGEIKAMEGTLYLQAPHLDSQLDLRPLGLAARMRSGIGFLPQQSTLLWSLTVKDNLNAALNSPACRKARQWTNLSNVEALLNDFELEEIASQRAANLSGGQIRRVELARLWACGARVLLCDEPMAGLDHQTLTNLQERLVSLANHGAAVLIADHRLDLMMALCHRFLKIEHGRIEPLSFPISSANIPEVPLCPCN